MTESIDRVRVGSGSETKCDSDQAAELPSCTPRLQRLSLVTRLYQRQGRNDNMMLLRWVYIVLAALSSPVIEKIDYEPVSVHELIID